MKIDGKDLRILDVLKNNAKLTTSQISKKVSLPITTVHNRIKRLTQQGIIKNFTINIDHEKLGKTICAYIFVTVDYTLKSGKKLEQKDIAFKIKKNSYVESVDMVTGETDIIIKLRTTNISELNNFITRTLRNIDGVDRTQTLVVLDEV